MMDAYSFFLIVGFGSAAAIVLLVAWAIWAIKSTEVKK